MSTQRIAFGMFDHARCNTKFRTPCVYVCTKSHMKDMSLSVCELV